jgi:hypothetical protein
VQGWVSVFPVKVLPNPANAPTVTPMLGEYNLRGSTLSFKPRFKPPPGLAVVATYQPANQPAISRLFYKPAGATATAPIVTAISPASELLPDNLLRMYVEFSQPMARGEANRRLSIVDEKGNPLSHPFVEIDQELWDPSGTRLTILFDPGRIKRGVKPNQDLGAPLVAGRRYGLRVARGWKSAAGQPLAADVVKTFMVSPPERRPIDLAAWKITEPKAGSRDPLSIDFGRPLDSALAADCLHVLREGDGVVGKVAVPDQARRWSLTPAEPWREGGYTLQIETRLEDLAGNRIGRAFDVDTIAAPQPRIDKSVETLAFSVR